MSLPHQRDAPSRNSFALDSASIADQFWHSLPRNKAGKRPAGDEDGDDVPNSSENDDVAVKKDTDTDASGDTKPQAVYAPACAFNVYAQVRKIALTDQEARRAEQATETKIPHQKQVSCELALPPPLLPPPSVLPARKLVHLSLSGCARECCWCVLAPFHHSTCKAVLLCLFERARVCCARAVLFYPPTHPPPPSSLH